MKNKKMMCDFCKKQPKIKMVIFSKKRMQVCSICKSVLYFENKRDEADANTLHGYGKC